MRETSLYKTDKPVFKEGDKVEVIEKQNGFEVGYIGTVTDFYIDAFSHVYFLDKGKSIQVGHLNAL